MLYKILENTPRELLFGVHKYQKRREKGEGLNPFWNRLKVEVFLGQFGQHPPFTCVKPVTNQQAKLARNHRKLKETIKKSLSKKITNSGQKSDWKK